MEKNICEGFFENIVIIIIVVTLHFKRNQFEVIFLVEWWLVSQTHQTRA